MAGETLLLDTNVLLAATLDPVRLPVTVRRQISDPNREILFSAASIWEIAIKRSLQRDGFDFQPEDIHALALETGFSELPVLSVHCPGVARLPWHHRDPFDRLLVAQARAIPAYLLTTDALLSTYSELVRVVTLSAW